MIEVYDAVYNTLAAGTALTTSLGGTAIYHVRAPTDQAYPYVVYNIQGGGLENINPSELGNEVYWIRAYSDISQYTADLIADQIKDLLHKKTLTIAGYTNISTQLESPITNLVTTGDDNKTIYCSGGLYRIRFDD